MAEVKRNDAAGRYEIIQDGQVVGFAEFRPAGEGAVMLPHTVVDEGHEGEGLGSQLAKAALDDLRAQGKKAVPTCAFIAGYIRKHPEYADLGDPQQRGALGL